jgi:hypothetical protein
MSTLLQVRNGNAKGQGTINANLKIKTIRAR